MSEGRYVIFSGAGVLVSGPRTLGVSLHLHDDGTVTWTWEAS